MDDRMPLTVGVQYLGIGEEYWDCFKRMDEQFRSASDEVLARDKESPRIVRARGNVTPEIAIWEPQGDGDVGVALEQIRAGSRAHVYVCDQGRAVGFRRMDFKEGVVQNGALYVDPFYADCAIDLSCEWLEGGERRAWQNLVYASYVLSARAGYSEVVTVTHNSHGRRAKAWQDRCLDRWAGEIARSDEPKELVNLIRENVGCFA
ncbi:MAG: hypothetical protein ABH864_02735 [archaeon]